MTTKLSVSLGSFIRQPALAAANVARRGIDVSCLGHIASPLLQICPQNLGVIDELTLDQINEAHPEANIRLHANIHLLPMRMLKDVVNFNPADPYWIRLKELTQYGAMSVYSAHAGLREDHDMTFVIEQQARLMDFLRIPVALEGHYPTRENRYLASDWAEWEMMFNSGLPYVVDLSHAAIIANLCRQRNDTLLIAMLSHANCLEVHISGNDERADQHTPLHGHEWWWSLMTHIHSEASIFYEGVFRV